MEENKDINNNNTYNTDMKTLDSSIGENEISDNIQNSTDDISPQSNDGLKPVLLILSDGQSPSDVEEPVLLEEDTEITYIPVINSEYENKVPEIKLGRDTQSYCNANYVIAVTESDPNTPISYVSTNLEPSYTDDGNSWCSVEFKNPLDVIFIQPQIRLNSTNFPDNSKIIVPVITCQKNTGSERSTIITFNIKNLNIEHNIQMKIIQNGETANQSGPCFVWLDGKGNPNFIRDDTSLYIHAENSTWFQLNKYIYNSSVDRDSPNLVYFAIKDINGSITGNLGTIRNESTGLNDTNISNHKLTTDDPNYKIILSTGRDIQETVGTTSIIKYKFDKVEETETGEKNIGLYYNGTYLRDLTVLTKKKATEEDYYTIYVYELPYFHTIALFNANGNIGEDGFRIGSAGFENVKTIEDDVEKQDMILVGYSPDNIPYSLTGSIEGLINGGRLMPDSNSKHDYLLTKKKYKDSHINIVKNVNSYDIWGYDGTTYRVEQEQIELDMLIDFYYSGGDSMIKQSETTFRFNNFDSISHLGIYRIKK